MLLGLVVLASGLPDENFCTLEPKMCLLNKVIDVIRCLPEHHVIDVVAEVDAHARAALLDPGNERPEDILRP